MAIGARSQSARTYLEKYLNSFKDSSLYELINHGVKALASTLPNETRLSNKNLSICVVGKDKVFHLLDETELETYINAEVAGSRSTREGDSADVGVGGTERQPYVPPVNPNDPDPAPAEPMTEDRRS
jgi:20S proteasome subunit alpha 6